jgi:hypothetical protein
MPQVLHFMKAISVNQASGGAAEHEPCHARACVRGDMRDGCALQIADVGRGCLQNAASGRCGVRNSASGNPLA